AYRQRDPASACSSCPAPAPCQSSNPLVTVATSASSPRPPLPLPATATNHRSLNAAGVLEGVKHRLGNLAYWDPRDNVTAANKPFLQKTSQFQLSKSAGTRALSSLPAWNESQYESRLKMLLDGACKVFVI